MFETISTPNHPMNFSFSIQLDGMYTAIIVGIIILVPTVLNFIRNRK